VLAQQARLQQQVQAQRRVGALGGEISRRRTRELRKADQVLAGAEDFLRGRQLVFEGAPRHLLDRVLELSAIEHIRHQHRAIIGKERDAVAAQQMRRALCVMHDLQHAGMFEQRLQPHHRFVARQPATTLEQFGWAMAERHVSRKSR